MLVIVRLRPCGLKTASALKNKLRFGVGAQPPGCLMLDQSCVPALDLRRGNPACSRGRIHVVKKQPQRRCESWLLKQGESMA